MRRWTQLRWLALVLVFGLTACEGGVGNPPDAGPGVCNESKASKVWLLPFGPVIQEVMTKGEAQVMVIVTRGSAKEGEGLAVPNQAVKFRVVTPGGDATLAAAEVTTDIDGLAKTVVRVGSTAMPYQVEAAVPRTCPTTFTIDVRQPLRQLRAVTATPFDTFTASRIPIAVEATTNGNAKLAGEEITFTLGAGKSADTVLSTTDGTDGGATLKVQTNGAGRATAMLATGPVAIPQLIVTAAMSGTADVQFVVRIALGKNKACTGDADCPLGYSCKNSVCEPPPPPPPPSGCKSDADCAPPTICQQTTGTCLMGTGKACDPIEGTGCAADEVCVGKQCAKIPAGCTDNSVCPPGWQCKNGACAPGGQPPTGGCTTNAACPQNQACINGSCIPKAACNIVHQPDRLQGTWQFDSLLHLRQALSPVLGGLLSVSGLLRNVIEGNFSIKGVPSFISSVVSKYLKKLIDQYVPPWGQQLIVALGDINDIVSDMRVKSTVQTTAVGNDGYVNDEQWDLVEFTYKTKKLSSPPSAIPEIGQINIPTYGSSEVCGVLFIDKHQLKNVIGGLIKWAINTALALVTCNSQGVPCFNSVGDALEQTINCAMLGMQLDMMVQSLWSSAPSVAQIVESGCNLEKDKLIKTLNGELDALTTKLSLLELSGTVAIPNPGADSTLTGGKWFGILGTGIAKGNFDGEFSAKRGP